MRCRLALLTLCGCACIGRAPPLDDDVVSAVDSVFVSPVERDQPFVEPEAELEAELEAEPEPAPLPFDGMSRVPLSALWTELEAIGLQMEGDAGTREEFAAFARAHALDDAPDVFRDYVRVKLAFEATRDGGWWNMRWAITNRPPDSKAIWTQWQAQVEVDLQRPTAVAECDELSALFAVVARRLGVDRIGLFWPVWNHVVAVWTVRGASGQDVRVVVPTSQIFLDADATLGTDGFDPRKQRTIYTYRSRDVSDRLELPVELARLFVQRAQMHALLPTHEQQRRRNERSERLGGS